MNVLKNNLVVKGNDCYSSNQYNSIIRSSLTNTIGDIKTMSTNYSEINIPYDLIVFGRSSENVITGRIPTRTEINNLFSFNQSAVNFGIGVHSSYWDKIITVTDNTVIAPIVCSNKIPNTQWNAKDFNNKIIQGFGQKTNSNGVYDQWGHCDSYHIRTDISNGRYDELSTNTYTTTNDYKVLQKELFVSGNFIYQVSLVRYRFESHLLTGKKVFINNKETNTSYYNEDEFTTDVNLLLCFKYTISGRLYLQGIEILNDNLTLGSTKLFNYSYPEYTTGDYTWTMKYDLGFNNVGSLSINQTPYKQTGGTFPLGNKSVNSALIQPYFFYPTIQPNSSITSFTTVYNTTTNRYGVIFRNEIGNTKLFELDATRQDIDFRVPDRQTQSFFRKDSRNPEVSKTPISETWSVNPSGAVSTTSATAFPVSTGDKKVSHSIYGYPGTGVLNKIYLTPGDTINVITSSGSYTGAISTGGINDYKVSNELNVCGVQYTTNDKLNYLNYIITDKSLYTHVFNATDASVKLYHTNRDKIVQISSDNVFDTSYNIEYDINKFAKISLPASLPSIISSVDSNFIYSLNATFTSDSSAKAAYEKRNQWKIYIEDVLIPIKNIARDKMTVTFQLNLQTYQENNPGELDIIFTVFGIDSYLPYILSTDEVVVDARTLDLGDLTFELGGVEYPMLTDGPSGVIHATREQVTTGFKINCTGTTDNVNTIVLRSVYDNSNWIKSPHNINYKDVIVTEFGTDSNKLSITNLKTNQFLVSGLILDVGNFINQKERFYIPPISVYDDHKFIIGKIYDDNIVEVDTVADNTVNKQVKTGGSFYPEFNDDGTYIFKFNFRCGPNYLDSANKYTLNYTNNPSHPITTRTTTPMIKQWWILGIPKNIYNNSEFENTVTNEWNKKTNITNVNKDPKHNPRIYYFEPYLNDLSIDYIYNKINDNGVVRCSGYYSTPSGYIDLNDITFTTTYDNQTLSDGVIPNGSYKIYFIVEDTLGQRTGIDLIYLNDIPDTRLPNLSMFTYGA